MANLKEGEPIPRKPSRPHYLMYDVNVLDVHGTQDKIVEETLREHRQEEEKRQQ